MSVTRIYYSFSALLGLGLGATMTTYAPYLISIGLSLGEIALVNTIFWSILIGAELPTGMLADGRSRAFSLKCGMVMQALGAFCYLFAQGFWSAALAEGFIGIGLAFMSGAQQAWIADALSREGRESEMRHVYATEALIRSSLFLLGGLLGAILALISYRLIWVPAIFTSLVAIYFCHAWMNHQGEPLERVSEAEAFVRSWKQLKQSRSLRWVIAAMVLFGAVVSFNHFWAPYFERQVGTLGLSWIWAIIYLVFMFAAWIVRRITIKIGREGNIIIGALILSGVGLIMIGLSSGLLLPIAAVVVHELGRGMFQPLTDSFVQHRVASSHRATFGSLQSFIGRIGFVIVPLLVWIWIEGEPNTVETISAVWLLCGAVLVAGSLILWLVRPKT